MPVYVPNTTWVDGSGGGTPLSAARLNNMELGISPPYIAYTPTWTASGTAPALGNGTLLGRYVQIGKFVHAYGKILFGTTSTYGTGNYLFALPVNASASIPAFQTAGSALVNQGANIAAVTPYTQSVTTLGFIYGATYLGSTTIVGLAAPFTWASTGFIDWNITYEAA